VKLLALTVLLLPSVLCAVVSGKYRRKARANKKPEVSWWRVYSSTGMEDPDLFDAEGNAYRKQANRWLNAAFLAAFLGSAVSVWLQQR